MEEVSPHPLITLISPTHTRAEYIGPQSEYYIGPPYLFALCPQQVSSFYLYPSWRCCLSSLSRTDALSVVSFVSRAPWKHKNKNEGSKNLPHFPQTGLHLFQEGGLASPEYYSVKLCETRKHCKICAAAFLCGPIVSGNNRSTRFIMGICTEFQSSESELKTTLVRKKQLQKLFSSVKSNWDPRSYGEDRGCETWKDVCFSYATLIQAGFRASPHMCSASVCRNIQMWALRNDNNARGISRSSDLLPCAVGCERTMRSYIIWVPSKAIFISKEGKFSSLSHCLDSFWTRMPWLVTSFKELALQPLSWNRMLAPPTKNTGITILSRLQSMPFCAALWTTYMHMPYTLQFGKRTPTTQ